MTGSGVRRGESSPIATGGLNTQEVTMAAKKKAPAKKKPAAKKK